MLIQVVSKKKKNVGEISLYTHIYIKNGFLFVLEEEGEEKNKTKECRYIYVYIYICGKTIVLTEGEKKKEWNKA